MLKEDGTHIEEQDQSSTERGRQRTNSILDIKEDQTTPLTPDPKTTILKEESEAEESITDEKGLQDNTETSESNSRNGDEGSEIDDKESQNDNPEETTEQTQGAQILTNEDDKKITKNLLLEETSNGAPLTEKLINFIPSFSAIELPKFLNIESSRSIKSFFPEKIEISPEMSFAGGAITGIAINPTLRYINDRFTGDNKDLSLFDYYSYNSFSVVDTVAGLASSVVLSYFGLHAIKMDLPMTFTAGILATTAPHAFELAYNVVDSSLHALTSLTGLSSDNAEF